MQQYFNGTFYLDVLNGSVLTKAPSQGCKPCTTTYTNDFAEFMPSETVILASFGFNPEWDLIGSASGIQLVDPPSAVPEPSVWALLLVGLGALKVAKRYGGEQLL